MQKKKNQFGLLPRILNGGIAGVIGVVSVFPIDLVKTRMQNQIIVDGRKQYKNMLDCALKVFRADGFLGLYRGCFVNAVLITPEKALKLVGNDVFRYLLKRRDGTVSYPCQVLAGAATGCVQTVITTPMELLKIQLQMASAGSATEKCTASRVALNLLREKGLKGFYKGCGPTVMRDVVFSTVYFPMFATLVKLNTDKELGTIPFYKSFAAGLISATFGAFIGTPFDVVKTRLQTAKLSKTYNGITDCFVKIYTEEGFQAFFKGSVARCMVVSPLFGIAQMFYYLGIAEFILNVDRITVIG